MAQRGNAFAVLDAQHQDDGFKPKGSLRRRKKRRSSMSGSAARAGASLLASTAAALDEDAASQDSASTAEAAACDAANGAAPSPRPAHVRVHAHSSPLSRRAPAAPPGSPSPQCPPQDCLQDAEGVWRGSFSEYLRAELNPATSAQQASADLLRGQNERQRVYNALLSVPYPNLNLTAWLPAPRRYNALLSVPYQLEQFLLFGLLICLDSFLAVFTVLPVRFARAAAAAARRALGRRPAPGAARPRAGGLAADQLFDVLCVLIFGATFAVLRRLPAGAIYFWLKDLTQEFLKLHVVHSAVEIFDKIAGAFVVDSLEALSGSCTIFVTGRGSRWAAGRLAADAAVTLALVIAHGAILLGQVMTFSVAMNSARGHALVALLIASNFVEIKGTIFKRFDAGKLFTLTCQDVAERFHLALSLLFVVVEEMDNAGSRAPNRALLQRCGAILAAEVAIDVTKHAVVTKFSDVRPGVYRQFLHDVCEKTRGSQSHTAHRVVAFEPYAPAALFLRIAATYLGAHRAAAGAATGLSAPRALAGRAGWLGAAALAWAALFAAKAALGFWLRAAAVHLLRRAARRAR